MPAAPFPDLRRAWLTHLDQSGKSQHTRHAYRRALDHFAAWYCALYQDDLHPAQVMPRDIRDWQAFQQQTEQAAPATANLRLTAVNRFFTWLEQHEHIPQNPARDVPAIHSRPRDIRSLEDTALRRLLRAAKTDPRDFAIIEVLAGTGVRVSELLALRIGDVVIQPRSGKLTVRYGKGGGYREIPLGRDVRHALQDYLDQAHAAPEDAGAALWLGREGELRNRSSITRLLEKYGELAGIAHVTPHMLRHTFATRYLNANPGDLRGLARLLGHTNLNTLMVYTEPTLDDLAQRMDRMDIG